MLWRSGLVSSLLGAIIVAISASTASNDVICSDIVRELTQTSLSTYSPIQQIFLDHSQAVANNKIFIVDNHQTEIYALQDPGHESCTQQIVNPTITWPFQQKNKNPFVNRKCYQKKIIGR